MNNQTVGIESNNHFMNTLIRSPNVINRIIYYFRFLSNTFKAILCSKICVFFNLFTVKPRLTATPGKNRHTLSCKKKKKKSLVNNTAKFFWPIGDRINGVPKKYADVI